MRRLIAALRRAWLNAVLRFHDQTISLLEQQRERVLADLAQARRERDQVAKRVLTGS